MRRIAAHGEIGVDVFFAISGFLICSLLLQEYRRTGRISLRGFYLRRFFRIVPPYYLVIAVLATLGILQMIPMDFKDLPSCIFFYRNYRPLGTDLAGGFYTSHFWSLAVEEHFYILWPTLLLLVKPKRIGSAAVVFAITVCVWREIEAHFHVGAALFYQQDLMSRTDTRIDSLLWACVAAVYFPVLKRFFDNIKFTEVWLPIAAVVVAVVAFHIPGSTLLIAVILPLLVLSTVVKPNSVLGRVLNSPPFRWIGTLSYSIYLWQQLFLPEIPSMRGHGELANLQHEPWNLLAILTCACLSHYLLERPMNRLGQRLSARAEQAGETASLLDPRLAL
jgi:peptidoglycan/LPS O-acetylase OafA/YrhL